MTTTHQLLELLAAAGLGSAIGLERELAAQPAGFRTHVLVALGSAMFTVVGTDLAGSDPSRIAAQVVTGVGFLGAGAILRDGGNVRGLTTAASLWVSAAAGVACGLGRPLLGSFGVAMALLALIALKQLEREVFPSRRPHSVVLEVIDTADLEAVVAQVLGVLHEPAKVRKVDRGPGDRTIVTLLAPVRKSDSMIGLAGALRGIEGVVGVELEA